MNKQNGRLIRHVILALAVAVTPVSGQAVGSAIAVSTASARSARAVLDDGITALGGMENLRALASVTRRLEGIRADRWQGRIPTPLFADDRPVITNNPSILSYRELRGQRAIDTLDDTVVGGQRMRMRTVLTPSALVQVYDEYVAGGVRRFPAPMIPALRARLFRRYPESLLMTASARADTLRLLPDGSFEGRGQRIVSFADSDGAQVSLYFDRSSHLLTKSEVVVDDPVLGDVASETVFGDYRSVGAVRLPYRYRDRLGDSLVQDLRAKEILVNVPADEALFNDHPELPTIAFPGAPTLKKVGEGVYIVAALYNSVFVVFDDYVVAVEPGGNTQMSEAAIRMINEASGGKPIRYVVATHFHADHIAGIRSYIAEGATIVTTPHAKQGIETAVRARHDLYPDRLSRAPREPKFELLQPSDPKRVFSDGKQRLEVHEISPNAHAEQMLVAYVPDLKLLFEADMLDIEVPGRTGTGGEDTASLLRRIEQLSLAVDTIVPSHGVPGTMEDLRQSVAKRGKARR